jgi:hypothetical protein
LLLSLAQHSPIDRSFLDRIPAPTIFQPFLSVNEDVIQYCRWLEVGTPYEDVLLFKSQPDKKNSKLNLIEMEEGTRSSANGNCGIGERSIIS